MMMLAELGLILVYFSVLTIKVCNYSADVCGHFGFGHSAKGAWDVGSTSD